MKRVLPALLLATGLAAAEPSDAPEEQVRRLYRTAIEESKKNHDYGTEMLVERLDSLEGRGLVAISVIGPMRTAPTEYGLTADIDLVEILSRSPKIQADCGALRVRIRAEMEAQDAILAAKIRDGVAEALRRGLAAQSARELDAQNAALEKLLLEGQVNGEDQVRAATDGARFQIPDFLRRLRDRISTDNEPGRSRAGFNDSQLGVSGYLPRSEFLDRMAQFQQSHHLRKYTERGEGLGEKLRQLISAIQSPADIANALEPLDELSRQDPNADPYFSGARAGTKEILKAYQQIHLDLSQGRETRIDVTNQPLAILEIMPGFPQKEPPREPSTSDRADIGQELSRLRAQLILQALPRLLGVAERSRHNPASPCRSIYKRWPARLGRNRIGICSPALSKSCRP